MTPTATVARTDPRAIRRVRTCTGFDMSFVRASGYGAGTIAEADQLRPRRVRRIIRAALRYWGLPGLIESAELLATELVTNALRHGRGDIRVRLYLTASHLLIEVRDGSHELPVPRNATPDDEDGRGLFLVDAFADDWGVSPDGTTTWCSLPF